MKHFEINKSKFNEVNLKEKLSTSGGSGMYMVYLEQLVRQELSDLIIDLS